MSLLGPRSPIGWAAITFNFAIGTIGLVVLVVATLGARGGDHAQPLLVLTFLGLFAFARLMRFEVPPNISASLIVPLQVAAIVLLGPVITAWIAIPMLFIEPVAERAFSGLAGRRRLAIVSIVAFNLGMNVLMTLAGGVAWHHLQPGHALLDDSVKGPLAVLGVFVVFKIVNETLMIVGNWLRGVAVSRYLPGARTTTVIETLTLPVGMLLALINQSLHAPAFILFVVGILCAAAVVRGLLHTRASLAGANADLERRVREVETLSRIAQAISADIELDKLLATIRDNCGDLLPANHFYIALWRSGEKTLRIAFEIEGGRRLPPKEISLGEGLTSHVILSRQPLIVHDLVAERDTLPAKPIFADDSDQEPNRSWLGVPLIARGECVGTIVLQDPRPRAFGEDDLRVLSAIAAQAAISVKNARLHQEALHALRVEEENRQLKRLNAKKSEFVAMVAHQFRTPLTSVIGYANLLAERLQKQGGSPIPDFERHLRTVVVESRRLVDMVEELLNLSRIRAGRHVITRQRFDLVRLLHETIASHQLLAEQRGLHVAVTSATLQADVLGDSNLVRQAFANVLANALKYAPEGSRIEVGVVTQPDSVEVRVTDEGPGVPAEDLERVFDEFYRAPGSTLEQPGSGLGLSIVRSIVEVHGGHSWAERAGAGTAFCLRLPARTAADAAAPSGETAAAPAR
jgi:signal transduction histidine kinase